jgi:hypothetical protein
MGRRGLRRQRVLQHAAGVVQFGLELLAQRRWQQLAGLRLACGSWKGVSGRTQIISHTVRSLINTISNVHCFVLQNGIITIQKGFTVR